MALCVSGNAPAVCTQLTYTRAGVYCQLSIVYVIHSVCSRAQQEATSIYKIIAKKTPLTRHIRISVTRISAEEIPLMLQHYTVCGDPWRAQLPRCNRQQWANRAATTNMSDTWRIPRYSSTNLFSEWYTLWWHDIVCMFVRSFHRLFPSSMLNNSIHTCTHTHAHPLACTQTHTQQTVHVFWAFLSLAFTCQKWWYNLMG